MIATVAKLARSESPARSLARKLALGFPQLSGNWACTDYVPHDSFGLKQTEGALFDGQEQHVPTWTSYWHSDGESHVPNSPSRTLTGKEEHRLFLRYNYARYRLGQLAQAQQRRICQTRTRKIKLWSERAEQARADLVRWNMALVMAMARRTRIPNVEFTELISEGNMALLRSVEKFDVSRGFRFSTYACRAILKSFNRLATKTGRYRQHFPVEYDPELEVSDYDLKKHEMQTEGSLESLREVLAANRANLSSLEQTIIMERFALASRDGRRTLSQVGKMVGLTNERVRQIQNLALGKIRAAMESEYLAA